MYDDDGRGRGKRKTTRRDPKLKISVSTILEKNRRPRRKTATCQCAYYLYNPIYLYIYTSIHLYICFPTTFLLLLPTLLFGVYTHTQQQQRTSPYVHKIRPPPFFFANFVCDGLSALSSSTQERTLMYRCIDV